MLVWERGQALLALPIEDVVEVAAVPGSGTIRSRGGAVEIALPRGLEGGPARRAVVVRRGGELSALPADAVDGVTVASHARLSEPPAWIRPLAAPRVRAILRLEDDRLAALLDLDALLDT